MANFYFSVNIDNDRTLCLAPLTDRLIEMSGEVIGDQSGYFLYEQCSTDPFAGIKIMAQVLSDEAAFQLKKLFNMS